MLCLYQQQFPVRILCLFHIIYCFRALLWCVPAPDKCPPPVKCVCLDQICPHTLLAQLAEVRSVTASICHFKPMRTHRDLRGHDSWSCRRLAASCFWSTTCAFPREGEQVNPVWSALVIQLICRKWANRIQQRNTAAYCVIMCSCV